MTKALFLKAVLGAWLLSMTAIALATTPSGAGFDLAEYRGKVVVVDFWASWCVPCRRSFPWLNAMHRKYADEGLVIIGVNVDQEADAAAKFLQEYPAQFRIRYDPHGDLAEEYDVQGMPSSFVFGRDGQLRARHLGFKVKRQDEYEVAILTALDQESVE